jgi:hypothetical protein
MDSHKEAPFASSLPLWSFRPSRDATIDVLTRADLEHALITRVVDDPSFRARLIAAPKEVLRAEYGVDIPNEFKVEVLEESSARTYLILPANPTGVAANQPDGPGLRSVAATVLGGRTPWWLEEDQAVDLVVRAWSDPQLAEEIEQDPAALLGRLDIVPPLAVEVIVKREDREMLYLVLPLLSAQNPLQVDEAWWKAANTGRRVKIAASLAATRPDLICTRAACTSFFCFCTFTGSTG